MSGRVKNIFTIAVLLVAVGAALLFFSRSAPDNDIDDGKLRVVATFFPLYDFARNIGGDKISLDILFSQTPEVSSFKPSDVQKINNADILIKNGAGLEPVIDDLVRSGSNANLLVVDTSKGVKLLNLDPHIWLDPNYAIIQVANIRDAFIERDPQNAAFYEKNTEEYIGRLKALDQELSSEISSFSKKDFISFHPSFQYFSERYGLNQAAVFEKSPGKEPTPGDIVRIEGIIKDLRITALFAEPQFSPKIVEVIAKDLGLSIEVLDPIETGNPEKDSYISIMQSNLQTIKKVLQ